MADLSRDEVIAELTNAGVEGAEQLYEGDPEFAGLLVEYGTLIKSGMVLVDPTTGQMNPTTPEAKVRLEAFFTRATSRDYLERMVAKDFQEIVDLLKS